MSTIVIGLLLSTLVSCKDKPDYSSGSRHPLGQWHARVERNGPANADSLKLVINGLVDLERPKAKVILIKPSIQKHPGELLLNLSKRPRRSMDAPAVVSYSEPVGSLTLYNTVRIMYRRDTVAVISAIATPELNKNN